MLLLDFLTMFDLSNKVTFPIQRQMNTIDLIISGLYSDHLSNFRQGRLFSNHHLLHFSLTTSAKVSYMKMIFHHKLKNRHHHIWLQCGKQSSKCQPQIHVTLRMYPKIQQPPVVTLG